MTTDWKRLTPEDFERLCHVLLEKSGFKNLQWFGSEGSDKGRDLVGTLSSTPLPGVERHERWVIQCKRYTRKSISKNELLELFASAKEHQPDAFLLITTKSLSANLKDWLSSVRDDYGFQIHLWEEHDLRSLIYKNRSELTDLFPEIQGDGQPLYLYQMGHMGVQVACNEFEEIVLWHMNATSYRDAIEEMNQFLKYIRENNFEFDMPDEEDNPKDRFGR
ncbi:MAG: restriction endonuclease, partial [Verrucomicrobiae bacterium]|nr:restriction endonuclease [Verrucomicrobiae bacterium]